MKVTWSPESLSLHRFVLRASEDTVKSDLEVTCTECTEHLCDAEGGDTLDTLVSVALSHECSRDTCRHCGRPIVHTENDGWIDPEATGDDSVWRGTCAAHGTFTAEHEPSGEQP